MNDGEWRLGLLAREARKNITAQGSRVLIALTVGLFVASSAAAFSAWESANFSDQLDDLAARGRNVVLISSSVSETPAAMTRASCEGLSQLGHVERAGGIVATGRSEVIPFGGGIPTFRVSSTLVPAISSYDAVLGSALAAQAAGSTTTIRVDGIVAHAVFAPEQPPGVDLNSGLLLPATVEDRDVRLCVVVLDDLATASIVVPSLVASLDSSGPPLAAVSALRESSDPISTYLQRFSRHWPLLSGAVIGLLLGLVTLGRTSELSAYLLSGTSRASFRELLIFEAAYVSGLCAMAATATGLVFNIAGDHVLVTAARGLQVGAVALLTTLAVTLSIANRRPSDLAKDR